MSYPTYERYKQSGVEWLGEVPEHWQLTRLKFLCDIQTGDKDTVNATDEGSYPFFVRSQTVERIGTYTFDCEAILTAGDGVGVGKVFHYHKGPFDFHQRVYMLNNFRGILGEFLFHYMRENFYKVALEGGAKSTVDSLRMPLFLNFIVAIPTENEQRAIIRVVTEALEKIDTLIAEQERLIALLAEKRQAVISHAVTRGLDPDVRMKDSGVEWIGEVPEHWAVAALRHRYQQILGKMLDTKKITGSHSLPYLRNTDVQWDRINSENLPVMDISPEEYDRYTLKVGDLVVCEGGDVGRCAIWTGELDVCGFQKALHRLRPIDIEQDNPRFMYYALFAAAKSKAFEDGNVSTIAHLTGDKLRAHRFTFPPSHEQDEIVGLLDSELGKIDQTISTVEHQITLLHERRTALISAAVTGKIDVRGLVDAPYELESA